MEKPKFHFEDVTLLITHYNRSSSLERLLKAFQEQNCTFDDIIVSDDASRPEHLKVLIALKKKYFFQLITTNLNKGLGNNINKGQDAVRTAYTLYVQEDFVPKESFLVHFQDALRIMNQEDEWDIIRFYSYIKYPYLQPYRKGFYKMVFKTWALNYLKIYQYSDHPHLRRSNFFEKFGRYAEKIKGDKTEYRMCISFIKNKGKGLFFLSFKHLFDQINSETEPSTMKRVHWKENNSFFIKFMRNAYRHIKYNLDIKF